jgi:hypothetical protein
MRQALANRRTPVAGYIGLAGVYDIAFHYVFEYSRGAHEVSAMKPACGGGHEPFPLIKTDLDPRTLFKIAAMTAPSNLHDTRSLSLTDRVVTSSLSPIRPCDVIAPSYISMYGMHENVPSSIWLQPLPLSIYRALPFFQLTSPTILAHYLSPSQARLLPPMLFIHGIEDETVSWVQSFHFAAALQRAHIITSSIAIGQKQSIDASITDRGMYSIAATWIGG